MCLEAPRPTRGFEPSVVGGVIEVSEDGAQFIEKTNDIPLADVGGLRDLPEPPGAVERMETE